MRSPAGGDAVPGRVIADAILAAGWRPTVRWTPRVRHDVRVSPVRVAGQSFSVVSPVVESCLDVAAVDDPHVLLIVPTLVR